MKLIAGNSNKQLASSIADLLDVKLVNANISSFSDNETRVDIEENMRGEDVFVIQSTSNPANHHIMELCIIMDALKRSSAKRITAVMPYFGYARQDRKSAPRTPITSKLTANLLTAAGADRICTMDLHAGQIQGFFDIPCDNLPGIPIFVKDIKRRFNQEELVVVSPDVGGVVRARDLARRLDVDIAIIDKRRERANESEVMNIIGNVEGKVCLMVDDMVDTAGTLCNAATALIEKGAISVDAYATHGVLSGKAFERITSTGSLSSLTVSDTIHHEELPEKIRTVTMAQFFQKTINRIAGDESVSALFTS